MKKKKKSFCVITFFFSYSCIFYFLYLVIYLFYISRQGIKKRVNFNIIYSNFNDIEFILFFKGIENMRKMKSFYEYLPKHQKVLDTGYHRMPHYVFDPRAVEQVEV